MNAVNPLQTQPPSGEPRPYEPSMEEILASIRRIIADDQSLAAGSAPRETLQEHRQQPNEPRQQAEEPRQEPMAEPHRPPPAHVFYAHASAPSPVSPSWEDAGGGADKVPDIGFADDIPPTPIDAVAALRTLVPDEVAVRPSLAQPAHESQASPHVTTMTPPDPRPPTPTDDVDGSAAYLEAPSDGDRRPTRADSRLDLFSASTHHSVSSSFSLLAATRLADNSDELLGLAREMIRPMLKTWLDDNLPSMVERMVRAEIERVARGGR